MKKEFTIFTFIAVSTLFGCTDDDKYNTSHPTKGGVILTVDWSNIESDMPSTYKAYIVYPSGKDTLFNNLSGTSNTLIVEPGKATLYVYNDAEHVHVEGSKATIKSDGDYIPSNPGAFYSFSTEIYTEKDKDIELIALMKQQTAELNFYINIPTSSLDGMKSITAVLEGVASEMDMQTSKMSSPSRVELTFTKKTYYAASSLQLLGFAQSSAPSIHLTIELENGNKFTNTGDLTSPLSAFHESSKKAFSLYNMIRYWYQNQPVLPNWNSKYLWAYPNDIVFSGDASSVKVSINTNQPEWVFLKFGDNTGWLTVNKSEEGLTISVPSNIGNDIRQARVMVHNSEFDDLLFDQIEIVQKNVPDGYYEDRELLQLQRATVGKGVNIVVMGDGYTLKDMQKETGKYEQDMRAAAEHFFSVYPFTEYRHYFNVYMIAALSAEEGISVLSPRKIVDTRFESRWDGDGSTYIICNESMVRYVIFSTPGFPVPSNNYHDLTVIMPINAKIYAGTTFVSPDIVNRDILGNGFSVCLCPVGSGFKEITVHEACGHGFAKVYDEYIDYPNEQIPEDEIKEINRFKAYGWNENVDFYSDILQTSWKGFAGHLKYDRVGAFEGAMYGKGIWKPEINSCMNNNIPYFNAPTRWAQVRRIHKLAGIDYTFSQFLQDDKAPPIPASLRSQTEPFIPLAPPVIVIND